MSSDGDDGNSTQQVREAILEANMASIKLPPFYDLDVDFWFTQVETQFHIKRVTNDRSRFDHVVAALDVGSLKRVIDIVRAPPEVNMYKTLKAAILRHCGIRPETKADLILNHPGIGDKTPSTLALELLALHDGHDCVLLRRIFIGHLPPQVQTALATCQQTDLRLLAEQADYLWQAGRDAVTNNYPTLPSPPVVDAVRKKQAKQGLCYFHSTFGKRARNCRDPCSWNMDQGNELAGRQ